MIGQPAQASINRLATWFWCGKASALYWKIRIAQKTAALLQVPMLSSSKARPATPAEHLDSKIASSAGC